MKANTTANLDFAQELLGAKSPSEAVELWTLIRASSTRPLPPRPRSSPGEPEGCDGAVEPIKASASKLFKRPPGRAAVFAFSPAVRRAV